MKRHVPEQLNTPAVSQEQETYSLEDIIREFSASPTEQDAPIAQTPSAAASAGQRQKSCDNHDTLVFRPVHAVTIEPDFNAPTKIAPGSDPGRIMPIKEVSPAPKPPKKPKLIKKTSQIPDGVIPTPLNEVLRICRTGLSARHIRILFLSIPAFSGLFLLLYWYNQWDFLPIVAEFGKALPIALLLISMILAYDVFLSVLRDLLHLRIGLHTLTVTACVLSLIQAFSKSEQIYCPVAAFLLLAQLKALHLSRVGAYHTLRTVSGFEAPMGIFDTKKLVPNTDSLQRDEADVPDFLYRLEYRNAPRRILRIYATALFFLLPALARLIGRGETFTELWLLFLLGAVPYGMSLSFVRPFASVAKRLSGYRGALCGWHGARIFGGRHTIVLTDEDLFPRKNIVSNGMKIYGAHKAPRIIAYALAALKLVDSPLADLFRSLLESQNGKTCPVSEHRIYDEGGIGAQISGDIVLVGSLSFMRAMGVHMPEGTRVRQAVYVSVNGELAGIFALKYKPNSSTRAGLRDVLANHNFSIILATRDFLISPELITAKYDLPTDAMHTPAYTERIRIAVDAPKERSRQGAMIAKDTFGAFAVTVASGRTLRLSTVASLCINLMVGLCGLLICILLFIWDSVDVASPFHIAAFQLLWGFLSSFVSFMILKF